jgi:hypothetical protein
MLICKLCMHVFMCVIGILLNVSKHIIFNYMNTKLAASDYSYELNQNFESECLYNSTIYSLIHYKIQICFYYEMISNNMMKLVVLLVLLQNVSHGYLTVTLIKPKIITLPPV